MAINPAKFIRDVRAEATRITWPTRKETTISTVMVMMMVLISAVFFFFADWALGHVIKWAFGFWS